MSEPTTEAQSPTGGVRAGLERLGPLAGRLAWVVPTLLTLGIGVYHAGRPLLWMDELATWNAVNRSTGELVRMLHHVDAVTGVYYLLIHEWAALFGRSLAVLRLPSALAMAGAAAFVALTARKLFGNRAAWTAGLLFALIPSISRYAQEVRGYAFVVLAVSAATFLLLRAIERPSVLRWLPYAVSLAVAGMFHMISLVFLCSHVLIVALRWWRSRDRRLLVGFPLTVVVGLLPVVPLVILGQRQVGRQLGWLTKPNLPYIADVFWRGLFASGWISLVVLALAVLPLAWDRGRRPALEVGLVAVLPIGLVWIVSQGHSHYFFDRYLLFTVPAWCVLAGAGLSRLRPRAVAPLGVVLVLLLGLHDQGAMRQPYARTNWDARSAAAVIAKGYQPGDGVAPVRGDIAYYQVNIALDYYLPDSVKLKDVFVARSAVARGDLYSTPCADPAACLTAVDAPRVWVVTTGWSDRPFNGFTAAEVKALTAAYPKQTSTPVPGMVVTLLER
ncbi:glycosyltransferase family 39 protein [Kitasatospora sp. NPDC058965]|uniref:glycosyltransferase family 39 protein n=1 Tax=Kitasatospora sp. NPDC058965 TaxID=3346682 RepID=UPI00367AE358